MMQDVATAKSEIAAFATGQGASSSPKSESNEQFGKVLQQQTSAHSIAVAPESPPPHSPSKRAAQQSVDETEHLPSSNPRKDPKTINSANEQTANSAQDKATKQTGTVGKEGNIAENEKFHYQDVVSETSDGSESAVVLDVANTASELQFVLPVKHNDMSSELADSSAQNVAQEWVSLVNNLQKLADSSKNDVQSLEVEVDVDKRPIDQLADKHMLEKLQIKKDDMSLSQVENNVELLIETKNDHTLIGTEKAQLNLSRFFEKALDNIGLNSEKEGLLDKVSVQDTVELLLEQPEVLQDLVNKLQIVNVKSGFDATEQQELDVSKEDEALLANHQVVTLEQIDLTQTENQTLLRTLLVDAETDKVIAQEPIKLKASSDQGELREQDIQQGQVATNHLLQSGKTEKLASHNELKFIVNLADNKLDKVLENIAQRVFEGKNNGEQINPEQIAQQGLIPLSADIISSVESSSKDFISTLKSGLAEYKSQLSLGREPGIDLKALVSEALAKTTDTTVTKSPINLEQILNNVSQVFDVAQTMSRAIEQHHDQVYSAALRDIAQVQGEQNKQVQLNQFESKFEKSVNITKSEGHQQLAEKVRWMVNTKNLIAEIRLDPAELGSMHVKVAVSGESATVNFIVQSQQAREVIDTATPRLKEMLAEKGIELGQSSVRQDSDSQQGQSDGEFANQGSHDNDDPENAELSAQVLGQQNIVNGALGGIDYFV